jgi:GNAT superfamily N-acetyltransferase
VELRPTADGDLPTLHAIFIAAIAGVFEPHGFDPPAPPLEVFSALQGHIRRTGTSVVAEENGAVVGFGSSWTRDDDWYLASLFIAPVAHGRGVGSALLDAVWGPPRARRRTMTDAIQPVSNVLYGRRGLLPATPVLTFTGRPSPIPVAATPGPVDLAAVDGASYGFDRRVDHQYWSSFARRSEWGDAYSYATAGEIGPVAGMTPDAAAAALAGELARAEGEVRVQIPGSARALVAVALAARLSVAPVPGLLLVSEEAGAPTAVAPSGYTLY